MLTLVAAAIWAVIRATRLGEAEHSAESARFQGRPCEIVAKFNGTERVLGNPHLLQQFSVGSEPCNALRIQEKGVEKQHVRVRRFRSGAWTATNLTRKSMDVNGTTVGPGKTAYLEFPAMLKLAETASFSLYLRPLKGPQDPSSSSGDAAGSVSHG